MFSRKLGDFALNQPGRVGAAAINADVEHQADVIVGEVNNGGDMVGYVIGSVDPRVTFSEVWASRGKYTSAEPISALYARRYGHHVGIFPELEEQMTTWVMEELRIQAKLYGHEPGVHTPRTATSPARFGTTVEHIDVGPIKHIGILD